MEDEILYLYDTTGRLICVQVPALLWQKLQPACQKLLDQAEKDAQTGHRLEEFADFMSAWNFPYEYKPEVNCPGCGYHTCNWQNGDDFRLHSANIGGILVFKCLKCGSTIRQKYFKTHMALEFTPAAT